MFTKGKSPIMAMARKMAEKKMAHGGKCYACGGQVNPELKESYMAKGGQMGSYKEDEDLEQTPEWDSFEKKALPREHALKDDVEPMYYAEGGGVDNDDTESILEADGDSDDLVYSPEVQEGSADTEEDDGGNDEEKRNGFLRAYLIHKKVRRG